MDRARFIITGILAVLLLSFFHGETSGEEINSGFVFYNGKYVEAPYRVERRDLAVFINGIQIRRGLKWPPRDLRVNEDPGMPDGVTSAGGLAALDTVRGPNGDT